MRSAVAWPRRFAWVMVPVRRAWCGWVGCIGRSGDLVTNMLRSINTAVPGTRRDGRLVRSSDCGRPRAGSDDEGHRTRRTAVLDVLLSVVTRLAGTTGPHVGATGAGPGRHLLLLGAPAQPCSVDAPVVGQRRRAEERILRHAGPGADRRGPHPGARQQLPAPDRHGEGRVEGGGRTTDATTTTLSRWATRRSRSTSQFAGHQLHLRGHGARNVRTTAHCTALPMARAWPAPFRSCREPTPHRH
jgi:hypothetical protein